MIKAWMKDYGTDDMKEFLQIDFDSIPAESWQDFTDLYEYVVYLKETVGYIPED